MAEPLRRTLCRLREKRTTGGPRAASFASPREPAGPRLEQPAPAPRARGPEEQPGARVPQEAADPGCAPRHVGAGSEGSGEDEDEEDADYYENMPAGCAPEGAGARRPAWPVRAAGSFPGAEGGRRETGRLQTQLREAYYLLIQAMHDLPPDSGTRRGGPVRARARGQPPPVPRSPRGREPGAGARPPQQVSPPRSPPREPGGGRPLSPQRLLSRSWSLESLRVRAQPPGLQRWPSDSWIRCGAHGDPDEPPPRGGRMDVWSGGCGRGASSAALLPGGCRYPSHLSGSGFRAATGPSGTRSSKEDRAEGLRFLQPPAVTVRKLQKWMYKGRLLSLGIKGRAQGTAPGIRGAQATSPNLDSWKVHKNHGLPVTPDPRITLTDLFENVCESSVKKREHEDPKGSTEPHKLLNSITVSKKRNWLYQSTLRSQSLEDNKKCQDRSHFSISAVSPPKYQLSQPFCKSPDEHCTHMVCNATNFSLSRNCSLDFSEENDADDEGEIWYNPIPEDDDLDVSGALRFEEANSTALSASLLSARDLMKAEPYMDLLPAQRMGDVQTAQSSGMNSIDAIHSTEVLQQYKQALRHKTQEGIMVEDSPVLKSAFSGPGILASTNRTEFGAMEPSSPSPSSLKKGSSINWSLPDKIKSPRTVRKLSMKMKRLPELSRKLSARGASQYINNPDNTPSLSKCSCQEIPHTVILPSGNPTTAAKRNVISRYHLDTTVSSQHTYQKKTAESSKYSCKGGYLSDGDSPELLTKSSKHGSEHRFGKGKEIIPNICSKNEIDIDAFRHYSFSDQPKCSQFISGLMSVHFYGAEDLKPPRLDSKDVFCAIQVDSVNKARTALLTCRTTFLDMDHTFNIEIENAQHLKLVVFSWEPTPRKNRVCCHGTVVLPTLFRVTRTHQLAVKLEPRGLIYVKVTLIEQWENSLHGLDKNQESVIFGVDIQKVVEKENVGLMVPLLIQKCIMEIEKRGCQVIGLYRLCGSAAVKKELREAFEKDSKTVGLCENKYPDINVITGVLKDYLRELPSPLITKQLYEAVLDAMVKSPLKMSSNGCENESSDSKLTVDLLNCLPDVEKATLKMLLDHLKLVASYHEVNKMTCQNLAVCFGPVLLNHRQETLTHNNRVFTDSEELASALDFKKHIEVLHYLLQLWPGNK